MSVVTVLPQQNLLFQRNLLLEEEQLLAARLCVLRSRLNDMVPISSLPPEVMEQIFHYCVACLYDTQPFKSPLAWTQVCRRWRLISLNSTRLWQCIDLCNPLFATHFLLRCKQTPLSIVSTSLLKYKFDVMSIRSNQLYSIDIFLFHADMIHLFSSIKHQLVNLTRLSLKVPPTKPLLLQDVYFPKVRYLSLDSVAMEWEQFHDLVRLSIRGLDSEYLPSITSLQSLLGRSPDLLSLRLENYLPAPQSHPSSHSSFSSSFYTSHHHLSHPSTPVGDTIIPLLRLCDFAICTSSSVASALFSVLRFGPSARIQLFSSLDVKEDLLDLFPNGLPYMSTSSSSLDHYQYQRNAVRRIRLSRSGLALMAHCSARNDDEAWMECVPASGGKGQQLQGQNNSFSLSQNNDLNTQTSTSTCTVLSFSSASSSITSPLASRICSSLPALLNTQPSVSNTNKSMSISPSHNHPNRSPMLHITHLELHTGVLLDLSRQALERFFRDVPNIKGLAVGFNDLKGLLEVLSLGCEDGSVYGGPPRTSQIFLPSLTTITFNRPSDMWWNFAERWLKDVWRMLERRVRMGVRVGRVEFYGCHGVCEDVCGGGGGEVVGINYKDVKGVNYKDVVGKVFVG